LKLKIRFCNSALVKQLILFEPGPKNERQVV